MGVSKRTKMICMKNGLKGAVVCVVFTANVVMGGAGPKSEDLPWIQMKNGHLSYGEDLAHNRIPDFSTAGYR